MSHNVTPEPDQYPSPEARELLSIVSKGEEILALAHAVRRAVQAKLKRLIRGRRITEGDPNPCVRLGPSAVPDAQRLHPSTPPRGVNPTIN